MRPIQPPRALLATTLLFATLATTVAAAPSPTVGYGSSAALITAKIQEGFFMGFELGLKKALGPARTAELISSNQLSTSALLSAERAASDLLKNGAVALVGFPGSNDSLLAANIARKNGVLALFVASNHNGLRDFGPDVYTTGHSMDAEVRTMRTFIDKHFKQRRGLVIINPTGVASASQEPLFKMAPNLTTRHLDENLLLDAETIQQLKQGRFDFLCFTSYPETMVGLVDQLTTNGLDLPIVAGTSWGGVDSDVMRRFIAAKKQPFYKAATWLKGRTESREFEKLFTQSYAQAPTPEAAAGYDLGAIVAATLKKVRGPLTKDSFKAAFHVTSCFDGLSVGRLCFGTSGGHAERTLHFLKFSKSGFVPVGG